MTEITIRKIQLGDDDLVIGASHLFDNVATKESAREFLVSPGHHLFLAFSSDHPVGFVSGVEMVHPDKGREMFLYELGVDEAFRRQGIATRLIGELRNLAKELGCRGMWVLADNEIAEKTYEKAGSDPAEDARMMEWKSL